MVWLNIKHGDEVGGCTGSRGNFDGVCPVSNRAEKIYRKRAFIFGAFVKVSGMSRITNRYVRKNETHGTVDFSNRLSPAFNY